jgi:hypothetical protein
MEVLLINVGAEVCFISLKADGSITTWGSLNNGGTNASNVPTDKGYTKPPASDSRHALIEPSALRTAKAPTVE